MATFNLPLTNSWFTIYRYQPNDFQFTPAKLTIFNLPLPNLRFSIYTSPVKINILNLPGKVMIFNLTLSKLRFSIYLWQSYDFQFTSDKLTIFNLPLENLRFSIYLWQSYDFQFTSGKVINFQFTPEWIENHNFARGKSTLLVVWQGKLEIISLTHVNSKS